MTYTPQTWTDGPAGGTPVSAARLGYIESGILAHDTDIAGKASALPEHASSARTTADATVANLLSKTTRFDTTSAPISQALPPATAGAQFAIGWDTGANTLTIVADGSDVIGSGATTSFVMPILGEVLTYHCTTAGRWRSTSGLKPQSALDARFVNNALFTTKGDTLGVSGAGTVVRVPVGTNGQVQTADSTQTVGWHWATPAAGGSDGNALTVGEETVSRDLCTLSNLANTSGTIRFNYFTAKKTETTTQVRVSSGSTAAGATPTLVKIGLYSVDGSGNLTLVASTASTTSMFAATNTAYTTAWAAPYAKVAGQRYALAYLVVTAAVLPTSVGFTIATPILAEAALDPRTNGQLAAQSDLPSTISAGSVATASGRYYAVVLP